MIALLQILPVLIFLLLIIYIAPPTQIRIEDNALHAKVLINTLFCFS